MNFLHFCSWEINVGIEVYFFFLERGAYKTKHVLVKVGNLEFFPLMFSFPIIKELQELNKS